MGAVKLGVAAGVGFTFGGRLGRAALGAVTKEASPDAMTGAEWGGRIVVFLGVAYLLSKF